ncbi:MAG: hypothetical protein IT374_09455 [Polyangiaceae bacterium]|nr:hypothetical protein [Polyangiaceae bacterium]
MTDRDDLDLPPTDEELRLAARLRDALEGEGDAFADALRAAHSPGELSRTANDALVDAALARAPGRPGGRVIRVVFGVGAAIVAAAAAAVVVATSSLAPAPSVTLSRSRSAEDLFDQPFPREGGTSARVERIASARQRDLRHNRYARWGVRP